MEKKIAYLIGEKYNSFSKTNKILADFVRTHASSVPFMSIKKLALQAGVSEASVTRFVRALSFTNFSEFIDCARQEIQQDLTPLASIRRAMELASEPNGPKSSVKEMIDQNIVSLSKIYTPKFDQNFQASVELITSAKHVYIIGSRSSYSVAFYLGSILNNLRSDVILLQPGDFSQFIDLSPEDCLIAIGFARYTRMTCITANYFHNHGCPVISITDSYRSPLALSAEYVLSVFTSSSYLVADAMSIAMYLVTAVAQQTPASSLARVGTMEKLGDEFNAYYW